VDASPAYAHFVEASRLVNGPELLRLAETIEKKIQTGGDVRNVFGALVSGVRFRIVKYCREVPRTSTSE